MSSLKRVVSHLIFWIVSVAFLAVFLRKETAPFRDTLTFVLLLLPAAIFTSYAFNYYLFPRYLFKGHYFRFSLYAFLTTMLSIYVEMMIVLFAYIYLAHYSYEDMIPRTTNIIDLGVGMYFVVFLSTLVYLVKRWSGKTEHIISGKKYLVIRVNREQVRLPVDEIQYVESLDNYVKVITANGHFITKEKISELEGKLEGQFLRIHRSFLVNREKIESYTRESMKLNGMELPISRTYKKEVLGILEG